MTKKVLRSARLPDNFDCTGFPLLFPLKIVCESYPKSQTKIVTFEDRLNQFENITLNNK